MLQMEAGYYHACFQFLDLNSSSAEEIFFGEAGSEVGKPCSTDSEVSPGVFFREG